MTQITDATSDREKRLVEALRKSHEHIAELREAWRTGALHETDGRGGERSNRNVDVEVLIRQTVTQLGYKLEKEDD